MLHVSKIPFPPICFSLTSAHPWLRHAGAGAGHSGSAALRPHGQCRRQYRYAGRGRRGPFAGLEMDFYKYLPVYTSDPSYQDGDHQEASLRHLFKCRRMDHLRRQTRRSSTSATIWRTLWAMRTAPAAACWPTRPSVTRPTCWSIANPSRRKIWCGRCWPATAP